MFEEILPLLFTYLLFTTFYQPFQDADTLIYNGLGIMGAAQAVQRGGIGVGPWQAQWIYGTVRNLPNTFKTIGKVFKKVTGNASRDIKNGIDQARLKRNVKEVYVNARAIAVLLKSNRVVCFGDPEFGGDSPWMLVNVRHLFTAEKGFVAVKMDGSTVRWPET